MPELMTPEEAAAFKAAHEGDHPCLDRSRVWGVTTHPCKPYRLAVRAEQLAEALAAEHARVARITRVLNDDNDGDAKHSVAALGIHMPKVLDFLEAAWRALGEQPEPAPAPVAADGHTVTVGGETTPHADLRLGPPDEFVQVQP